jgi:hypothetical protein
MLLPLLGQGNGNLEVTGWGAATALVIVILDRVKSWWTDYSNNKRDTRRDVEKANRDNEQTEFLRKIHDEQVATKTALIVSAKVGDERFGNFIKDRDRQHKEIIDEIKVVQNQIEEVKTDL